MSFAPTELRLAVVRPTAMDCTLVPCQEGSEQLRSRSFLILMRRAHRLAGEPSSPAANLLHAGRDRSLISSGLAFLEDTH